MLRFYAIGPWLLIPLGLVGLVFFAPPPPRRRDFLIWAAFVPGYAVGVAAFFVAERYRLPLLVPLCVGAGAAIDSGLRAYASRRAIGARGACDGARRLVRAHELAAAAARRPLGGRTAAGGAPGDDRPLRRGRATGDDARSQRAEARRRPVRRRRAVARGPASRARAAAPAPRGTMPVCPTVATISPSRCNKRATSRPRLA